MKETMKKQKKKEYDLASIQTRQMKDSDETKTRVKRSRTEGNNKENKKKG